MADRSNIQAAPPIHAGSRSDDSIGELESRLGTMQGRLVPSLTGELQCFPEGLWDREMQIASELGFAHLEWLVPAAEPYRNPLFDDGHFSRIRELSRALNLGIASICVDPLMVTPLCHPDIMALLRKLASRAALLQADGLVLPLLEASAPDDLDLTRHTLAELVRSLEGTGIRLYVEVTTGADRAQRLVLDRDPRTLGLCLDTGNLTRAGIDPFRWYEALSQHVSHVHLKNVDAGGTNVVFSDGVLDISTFVRRITTAGYTGRFTFETARGDDPIRTAARHRRLVLSAATTGEEGH